MRIEIEGEYSEFVITVEGDDYTVVFENGSWHIGGPEPLSKVASFAVRKGGKPRVLAKALETILEQHDFAD